MGTLIVPGVVAAAGILAMVLWLTTGSVDTLQARVPGLDRTGLELLPAGPSGPATGQLIPGPGKAATDIPGAWPWFRGLNRDNIAADKTPLARQWPAGGPKVLWSVELGEGHAGPVVRDGRVYLLDYDRDKSADALRCLSLADGKQEIWRYSYPVEVKRNHGMSRTVPAVAGDSVVAIGPKCHVTCLDATTGQRQWMIDLVRQYGAEVPRWYAGQCPLVDGDRVIFAPGGKDALMIAVDLKTGSPKWKTPNRHQWLMTHASIVPMEFRGRRMYVYLASGGVVGVSADSGAVLWETPDWQISIATVPSPVCLPEGKIFLSGGYSAGAMMLQLEEQGGGLAVKSLFRLKARQFGSTQHTPIFYNGHLYGVREDKELVCLDLKGQPVWRSGSQHRFGIGPYLIADGLIFVMNDEGLLAMAEASPAGYRELGRAQVLEGPDSWGPMALVAGRLLARDSTRMVCLDLRKP
jgi:outer membrane protein assembly factor BamB